MRIEENLNGGRGRAYIRELLDKKQMNGKCGLYAQITLEPGSSIGYHVHHGESETYFILQGEGEYNDNGALRGVREGDVTYTSDGCGHALKNTGKENLVFMALIIYI